MEAFAAALPTVASFVGGLFGSGAEANATSEAARLAADAKRYEVDKQYLSQTEQRAQELKLAERKELLDQSMIQQGFDENQRQRIYQAAESEKTRSFSREQTAGTKQAYEQLLKRGQESERAGENQVMNETAQAPQELRTLQEGIRSGQNQDIQTAVNEYQAGLSKQGVRGPQAGNLLGRYQGQLRQNAMKDVNQLAYEDAKRRQEQRLQVAQNKAISGTKANLTPATY